MDKRKGERNEREAEDRSEREWLAFSDDWQHMLFANPPPLQKHSPVRSVRAKCSSPLFPVMMSPGKAKDTLKLISGHCNLFWGCSPHPLCVPSSNWCRCGEEAGMWIIIWQRSPAECTSLLNMYKRKLFSSKVRSRRSPHVLYWTEGRMERNQLGRSEWIMHFHSPYWCCIDFLFSEWPDQVSLKSLSYYCHRFFFQGWVNSWLQFETVIVFYSCMVPRKGSRFCEL